MKKLFTLALAVAAIGLTACKKDAPAPNESANSQPAAVDQPAPGTVEAQVNTILDGQAEAVAKDNVEQYAKLAAELDSLGNSLNESDQKKFETALDKWAAAHQDLEAAFDDFADRHEMEL